MISKPFVLPINSFQHSYRKANIIIFEIQCNVMLPLAVLLTSYVKQSQTVYNFNTIKTIQCLSFLSCALFDLS